MTPLGELQLIEAIRSIASDLSAMKAMFKDTIDWLKRAMILVGLYGSGLILLLLSDEKAKLAADLIRAIR